MKGISNFKYFRILMLEGSFIANVSVIQTAQLTRTNSSYILVIVSLPLIYKSDILFIL